jgi:hypothetical protein
MTELVLETRFTDSWFSAPFVTAHTNSNFKDFWYIKEDDFLGVREIDYDVLDRKCISGNSSFPEGGDSKVGNWSQKLVRLHLKNDEGVVVHVGGPSYLGGGGRRMRPKTLSEK